MRGRHKSMAQSKIDSKDEYIILLDLLSRVNNANEGVSFEDISDGERLLDAHFLTNKFISHALTILHLLHGTHIQDLPSFKPLRLLDAASIDVLTRTAMEAFLVFHYVFFAATATEEKNYRYWTYRAAGIAERQNLPETAYEYKQAKAEDKKELDKLRDKLKSNAVFQSLTEKQESRFFEGKERNLWRWKPDVKKVLSWSDIAIDAGFSKMLASYMYRHLSGYSHSSSLSVLQAAQALVNKETEQLIKPSIDTMKVLTANMIREYCGLFPKALDVLKESGATKFVDTWIHVGCRLDEHMGIGSENE